MTIGTAKIALIMMVLVGAMILTASSVMAADFHIVPAACRSGGSGCNVCYMAVGLNNLTSYLMKFIALPAAGLLVAIGGLVLLTAGSSAERVTLGKKILTSALVGLIIVFLAWIMVDTLIKLLTGGKDYLVTGFGPWNGIPQEKIDSCSLGRAYVPPPIVVTPPPSVGQCQSCVALNGLPIKQNACAPPGLCQINGEVAGELQLLNQKLTSAGVNWEITEAWPPTVQHQDPCHQNGTCIDASLRGSSASQPNAINTFIQNAKTSGLRAVYEVTNAARRDQLIASGVPSSSIQVVPGINGEHFSVYNV